MWFDFLKKKEEKKKEIRYILTIDGGGMRGIVPSSILKKMNEELKKLTNRPLYSYFDLIAGTSTGALLALGLTSPIEGTSFEKEKGENERQAVAPAFHLEGICSFNARRFYDGAGDLLF